MFFLTSLLKYFNIDHFRKILHKIVEPVTSILNADNGVPNLFKIYDDFFLKNHENNQDKFLHLL